jgi:hypothetical protein
MLNPAALSPVRGGLNNAGALAIELGGRLGGAEFPHRAILSFFLPWISCPSQKHLLDLVSNSP